MSLKSYDSKQSFLAVGGIPMHGFGDNKITISRNNDVTSMIEGVDGENTISFSNKKAGTISFELQYMSKYDILMDNLSNVKYLVPIAFSDLSTLKGLITEGAIMTQPDIVLGEEPENRVWTILVNSTDMSIAGSVSELFGTVTKYIPSN